MELSNWSREALWVGVTGVIFLRYLLMAGIPYLYFYGPKAENWKRRKLQAAYPSSRQIRKEIAYSLRSLLIYSAGAWFFLGWILEDRTLRYARVEDFGWLYLGLSFVAMILLHDAYFYWTHRLMHHRVFYKWTHRTHHAFRNPSPWCAFAFHPAEAVLSMGIIPLIVFIIPWHYYAFIAFLSAMTLYDVYIHLGFKLIPMRTAGFSYSPDLHDWHHRRSRGNYGLYFTFWDRLMQTFRTPASPHRHQGAG